MTEFLYRFRSVKSLFEHQELENQEIYFSPPNQLNDPLEGFKDIYWSGDEIVWKNLLRHYLLCLEQVCTLLLLSNKDEHIHGADIPVFKIESDFPTPQYKDLYRRICETFFGNEAISKYPNWLSKRVSPVRRNELVFYLRHMHFFALDVIFSIYEERGFLEKRQVNDPLRKIGNKSVIDPEKLNGVNELEGKATTDRSVAEQVYEMQNKLHSQIFLMTKYNNASTPLAQSKEMLFFTFPEHYVKELERIVHADWYTACFVSNSNSPSMWGYYGDNHKGVSLKFKNQNRDGVPFIRLRGITGWGGTKEKSGPIYGDIDHQFYEVSYTNQYPEINFFRSLGRPSRPAVSACWYRDENGKVSDCADDMFRKEQQWRTNYWKAFYKGITTKLEGWAHEGEYRLLLSGAMSDYSKPESRKLKYYFEDLDGIIFGIDTSMEDKLRIIKIIESKCIKENRNDFKFYQAAFSRKLGNIEISEMGLLKFEMK